MYWNQHNIANLANAGLSTGESAGKFVNGISSFRNLLRWSYGDRVQKGLFEFPSRETST